MRQDNYDQFDDDAIPIKRRAKKAPRQESPAPAKAIPVAAPRRAAAVKTSSPKPASAMTSAPQKPAGTTRPAQTQKAAVSARPSSGVPKHAVPYKSLDAQKNARPASTQAPRRPVEKPAKAIPVARPVTRTEPDEVRIPVRSDRKKAKGLDLGAKKEKKGFRQKSRSKQPD